MTGFSSPLFSKCWTHFKSLFSSVPVMKNTATIDYNVDAIKISSRPQWFYSVMLFVLNFAYSCVQLTSHLQPSKCLCFFAMFESFTVFCWAHWQATYTSCCQPMQKNLRSLHRSSSVYTSLWTFCFQCLLKIDLSSTPVYYAFYTVQ